MIKRIIYTILLFLFITSPILVLADSDGMKMTITPPLIKNNMNPGQLWKSAIKIVNNNSHEITIHTEVLDFKGGKDNGTVEFLEKKEKKDDEKISTHLLSEWIIMDSEPITIPAFKSKEISFIIDVPKDAEPGGHYAAILAGVNPPDKKIIGSVTKVSSLLASLILLNVQGDIKEEGKIRDFSTKKIVYPEANIDFNLRFQNTGNVHIQPQGEIDIFNMYGKKVAQLPINHKTEFGNTLPGDTRKWTYNWKKDKSILDMGRYRADLIISYGNKEKTTVNKSLYFWIIDFKILFSVLGIIFFFFLLLFLSIKFYIKKSILKTQKELEKINSSMSLENNISSKTFLKNKEEIKKQKKKKTKIIDLKQNIKK